MATSQNGWPVHTTSSGLLPLPWITGRVLPGDVYTIFDYLCRRFDAEVEPITVAHSWGWANRPVRGSGDTSNHASATALDLNAPKHPLGAVNTFTPGQRSKLRAILRDLDGVVRWGGDYAGRKDEMHLEIDASAAAVAAVARSLTQTTPTSTGGFMADMSEKEKRELLAGVAETRKLAGETHTMAEQNRDKLERLEKDAKTRHLADLGRHRALAKVVEALDLNLDEAALRAQLRAAVEGIDITITTKES